MGTTTFTTDMTPGQIIADELCFDGARVRMFNATNEGACVAMRYDLSTASDDMRRDLLAIYDLPDNASCVVAAVIIKGHGFTGQGMRSVSVKIMGEQVGPYYTCGATAQLLSILSPLRKAAPSAEYARAWRGRAWAATKGQVYAA